MDTRFAITLPPGIVKNDSPYAVKGRYITASFVRSWQGKMQKWGGWGNFYNIAFTEPARGGLVWNTLDGTTLAAFGTANKLWVVKQGVKYDITPAGLSVGLVSSGAGADTGYGDGGYGDGPYGGGWASVSGQGAFARVWTLARWGEDLVACARGGPIYFWDSSTGTGTPAVALSTMTADAQLPSSALGVFVSDDRHLIAYGAAQAPAAYDALNIAWCNREDLTTWTPAVTNTAGAIRCESGNQIMGCTKTFGGYLVVTDLSAHPFTFVGGDDIWGLDRIGAAGGAISPQAIVEMDGIAYWMGFDAHYSYNGRVNKIPCDLHKDVFDNLNKPQAYKIIAGTNRAFNELIFFWPDLTGLENNRYHALNLFDGTWSGGSDGDAISRTTWIDANAFVRSPLAVDGVNFKIYQHDSGTTADGVPFSYRLETGELEMVAEQSVQASDSWLRLKKIVPDFAYISGAHALTVYARGYPNDAAVAKGPYDISANRMFNPKARGRSFRYRFEGTGDFRMGDIQAYASPDGGRP